MKLRLETRHRLLVIATGDDADELDNCDDEVQAVAGPAAADLTEAPAAAPDPRVEPEDRARRRRGASMGFAP